MLGLLACISLNASGQTETTIEQINFDQQDLEKLAQIIQQKIQSDSLLSLNPQNTINLDRDDIERTGLNDLSDVLRQLPAVTGSPISTRSNRAINNLVRGSFQQPGTRDADGRTRTDLRGLGTEHTLVLIDGRRDISDGDLSLIPLNLVERIEVLQEGASAIYGADAVGGVVNIITRDVFEGFELQAQYGTAFGLIDNPAAQFNSAYAGSNGNAGRVSGIAGWKFNRGRLIAGVEYNDQSSVYQGNVSTSHIQNVIDILDSDDIASAGFRRSLNSDIDGDGIPGAIDTAGSTAGLGGFFCTEAQGEACVNPGTFDLETGQFRAFDPNTDLFNSAQYNLLQTPFERTNLFIRSEYKIADFITAQISGRYALRETIQEFAPPAFISSDLASLALPQDENLIFLFNVPVDNPFNPFNEELVDVRGRLTGVRTLDNQQLEQFAVTAGFKGNFGKGLSSWGWDANWSFGHIEKTGNSGITIDSGLFLFGISNAFINDAGTPRCGTPERPFENCTPANIFNGFANIPPEQIPGLETSGRVDIADIPESNDSLQLASIGLYGDLWQLPAGPIATAIGYEFRYQNRDVDGFRFSCFSCNFASSFGRFGSGDFSVHSGYAEINVPIFKNLTAIAAARHDNYSNSGAYTSFKTILNWRLLPQLSLRGNYSEVIREPSLRELFLVQADAFPFFLDACRSSAVVIGDFTNSFAGLTAEQQEQCLDSGVEITGFDEDGNPLTFSQTNAQPRTRVGGNENLRLETGDSFSIGMAFSPKTLPGLLLSLDYWNIRLKDTLVVPDAERILNSCIFAGLNESCDRITRQSLGNTGEISEIAGRITNQGIEQADGIDFNIQYSRNIQWGQLESRLLLSWLNNRETASFDPAGDTVFSDRINVAGTFTSRNNFQPGVYPEWKALLTVDWNLAPFAAALSMEYLSGVDEILDNSGDLINQINAQVYVDMNVSYTLPFGTEITGGITNIFDNDPPFIAGAINARTDTDTYRILGRSWFARITQRF